MVHVEFETGFLSMFVKETPVKQVQNKGHHTRSRSGFSLIELLVVILIIALIVAIVLPALGGARNVAKRSDTEALVSQYSQAIGSFQIDNKRQPGRYSVRDMADPENLTRGMSMSENVMLELGAMRVAEGNAAPDADPNWVRVGPFANPAQQVWANPTQQATSLKGGKGYFTPTAKNYVAQPNNPPGQIAQEGAPGHTDLSGRPQLPDVVDAFGNPLLVWLEDEASVGKPEAAIGTAGNAGKTAFARETYTPAGGPAKFYWGTNSAFLRATNLGRSGADMTSVDPEKGNYIGGAAGGLPQLNAMVAILGNPGFPNSDPTTNTVDMWPTASRGSYAIQSAGIDGRFVGRNARYNRGSTLAIGGTLYFGSAIKDAGNTAHVDPTGRATTFDFAKEFDDLLVSGN